MGNHQSRKLNKKDAKAVDRFIINFNKNHGNNVEDISSITDQRRLVFVSLLGLFRSYQDCPPHLLFTALFLLPLKREWIYNPSKYQHELNSKFSGVGITRKGDQKVKEFMQLLRWKDSQGFVFWMLDDIHSCNGETKNGDNNSTVAPFWRSLSDKLCTIYDAVNQQNCHPLCLDEQYWRDTESAKEYKFTSKTDDILNELQNVQMKYSTIQEIIYQSNPMSLNPITVYNVSVLEMDDEVEPTETKVAKMDHCHSVESETVFQDDSGFWISDEYLYESEPDFMDDDDEDDEDYVDVRF